MEDRIEFGIEPVEQEEREFVAMARNLIARQMQVIALSARLSGDIYWVTNKITREEGSPDEQCRIGTRVIIVNGSLVAEWYRNRLNQSRIDKEKYFIDTP